MNATQKPDETLIPLIDDPNARLEIMYIEEYLKGQGLSLKALQSLEAEVRHQYMVAACLYASFRLAEVEDRAKFVQNLHL